MPTARFTVVTLRQYPLTIVQNKVNQFHELNNMNRNLLERVFVISIQRRGLATYLSYPSYTPVSVSPTTQSWTIPVLYLSDMNWFPYRIFIWLFWLIVLLLLSVLFIDNLQPSFLIQPIPKLNKSINTTVNIFIFSFFIYLFQSISTLPGVLVKNKYISQLHTVYIYFFFFFFFVMFTELNVSEHVQTQQY